MFNDDWETLESRAARDADYDGYRDYDYEDGAREARIDEERYSRR